MNKTKKSPKKIAKKNKHLQPRLLAPQSVPVDEVVQPGRPRRYLEMLVIRLGDDNRPAGNEDIQDCIKQMTEICNDQHGNPILVTHHAIQFELVRIPCHRGAIMIRGGDKDQNEFDATSPIQIK
jgi:hypothetical protein